MASVGVATDLNRLGGWEHVEQSIRIILSTPIGSRVMRRDFGSRLHELIDAPMNDRNKLAAFVAIAEAISKWEPRFRLENVMVDTATAGGEIGFILTGKYFPRGHLGDFSVQEGAVARASIGGIR